MYNNGPRALLRLERTMNLLSLEGGREGGEGGREGGREGGEGREGEKGREGGSRWWEGGEGGRIPQYLNNNLT